MVYRYQGNWTNNVQVYRLTVGLLWNWEIIGNRRPTAYWVSISCLKLVIFISMQCNSQVLSLSGSDMHCTDWKCPHWMYCTHIHQFVHTCVCVCILKMPAVYMHVHTYTCGLSNTCIVIHGLIGLCLQDASIHVPTWSLHWNINIVVMVTAFILLL